MTALSRRRRQEIIGALRRGTVPQAGLDVLAVGLGHFEQAVDEELRAVAAGGAQFKAVRGDYGSGKTFYSRWLTERARAEGFASAEIQISETETQLHKLETVYRRIADSMSTPSFRDVIDGWFFVLDGDVRDSGAQTPEEIETATAELLEKRLARVTAEAPAFAQVLRAYHRALVQGDRGLADQLLSWVAGQPHVAASARRAAGVRGDIDHYQALGFLQGLLTVLRDSDYQGLMLVLDEVETLQRVRTDVREKSLNALRQLMDEVDAGRFPGLYLVMTGTPAFYDGPQGVQRLPPLAQRLQTDFGTDPRFDNPRATQIRLHSFGPESLLELGSRVRDIYADGSASPERVRALVDDAYVANLGRAVAGSLGGRVGIAPRVYLKKLVADVLDRVDQFADFDPRQHYRLTLNAGELTEVERNATVGSASSPDEVEL